MKNKIRLLSKLKYLVLGYSFIKSQNLSMWTNHLFHKYHCCHVIDTVIQLYMIVDLGIKLKSMSVRSCRSTSLRLPWNPHIAARVLLKRANLSLVLMYVMTDAYGSLRFSAIFSASLLLTLLHSGAIPPLVVKTRGLNEDFSLSITVWLYLTVRQDMWSLCQRSFLTAIP